MQFKDIPGHQDLKHTLMHAVQKNRLSHALLFLGHEGNGGLPMAVAFAQYILCDTVNRRSRPQSSSLFGEEEVDTTILTDSCGTCPSCQKISGFMHPDVHFSYPTVRRDSDHKKVLSTDYIKEWRQFLTEHPYENVTGWLDFLKANAKPAIDKPENKQGNITVNECDDITAKLSLKSFEGFYKILIMWMPEYLASEGNKLLKLIEEPPANTIFLLVATDDSLILPTILSRTQLVKIPLYSDDEIRDTLLQKGIDKDKATQITALAEGNYLEALQLIHHTGEDWQEEVRAWLNTIWKGNVSEQAKWIEKMSKNGREKQKQFLRYFVHILRLAIRMRYAGEEESTHDDKTEFISRINAMCTVDMQMVITEELEKAMYYIERNANSKILFHALSIRLHHIIRNNSLILVN